MKFHILTYGCQMNKSDSERIAAALEKTGHEKAASEKTALRPGSGQADLIILNACSVRQTAVDRIYGKIKQIQKSKFKMQNKIILTGCLLETDRKKLQDKVDLIFGIADLPKLPKFLKKICNPRFIIRNLETKENKKQNYFEIQPKYSDKKSAYVPIMTGCDNFCSYCVVPYTRGREKSRIAKDIIQEVKNLLRHGFKEITLLGQNVNSYRSTDYGLPTTAKKQKSVAGSRLTVVNFSKLLKRIHDISGDFKISFITAHPKDMTGETIETLKLPKISNSLHLPVQSGSNRILKLMNRHYTAAHYLKLVRKIRRAKPGIRIGTDIIVGFPGETKKDFQKTVEFCKKAGFDNAYVAQYSPRAGTLAAKIYKDETPADEKKRRWLILNNLINKKAPNHNWRLRNRRNVQKF